MKETAMFAFKYLYPSVILNVAFGLSLHFSAEIKCIVKTNINATFLMAVKDFEKEMAASL